MSETETVSIPASLLRDLIWAAESLTNIEPDGDDREMIVGARRAMEQQAPWMATAMLEVELMMVGEDDARG